MPGARTTTATATATAEGSSQHSFLRKNNQTLTRAYQTKLFTALEREKTKLIGPAFTGKVFTGKTALVLSCSVALLTVFLVHAEQKRDKALLRKGVYEDLKRSEQKLKEIEGASEEHRSSLDSNKKK